MLKGAISTCLPSEWPISMLAAAGTEPQRLAWEYPPSVFPGMDAQTIWSRANSTVEEFDSKCPDVGKVFVSGDPLVIPLMVALLQERGYVPVEAIVETSLQWRLLPNGSYESSYMHEVKGFRPFTRHEKPIPPDQWRSPLLPIEISISEYWVQDWPDTMIESCGVASRADILEIPFPRIETDVAMRPHEGTYALLVDAKVNYLVEIISYNRPMRCGVFVMGNSLAMTVALVERLQEQGFCPFGACFSDFTHTRVAPYGTTERVLEKQFAGFLPYPGIREPRPISRWWNHPQGCFPPTICD